MPRFAQPYAYTEPSDPSDTFDRLTRDTSRWTPDDDEGLAAERGEPVSEEMMDAYTKKGRQITKCPTPIQKEPEIELTESQKGWSREFHPLSRVPDAVLAVKHYIETMEPMFLREHLWVARAKKAAHAIGLEGLTQAEFADELGVDQAVMSRALAKARRRWPGLGHSLTLLNLLNLREKRHEPSSRRPFPLLGENENRDTPPHSHHDVKQSAPYANYPAHVKLARLMHRVFPPARSNFVATVAKDAVDAPSRGTQRIERIKFDDFGSEIDRADYRAKIGRDVDYERRRTAIAQWQRMRRSVGIGNGQLTPKHENLLQRFAEEFFRAEDLFNKATNTADPAADLPQSLLDAPWITLPEPDRAAPSQYTAPYTPHVNECPKPSSKKSKLWPNKYQPPKKYHNGRKLRTHRWAFGVYNAKDENANNRLKKMFPEPPPMRGEVIVKILRDYRPPEQQQEPAREFIKYADHCFVNTKSAGLMKMEVTPVAYKSTKDPIALISTGELARSSARSSSQRIRHPQSDEQVLRHIA